MIWLVVLVLTVALNAVPAFMPPTWAVLAYFHLYHGLPVVPLAFVGALGATTGRAILALGSRAFGNRFVPARRRSSPALRREPERLDLRVDPLRQDSHGFEHISSKTAKRCSDCTLPAQNQQR